MFAKNFTKGLLAAGAMTALSIGSASAAGTAAGTSVENTFTLDYNVGGIAQPTIDTGVGGTNTPTVFTVDRLVDLTVASSGNTVVAPGAQDEELTFVLTNNGNDTQAYTLDLVNEVETTGVADDHFDATGLNIVYYVGNSATGDAFPYDPTTDLTTIDVPADGQIFVVVTGDIPGASATLDDGDTSDITLVADTVEPNGVTGDIADTNSYNQPSTPVTPDVGGNDANLTVVENVLADGEADAAPTNSPYNNEDANDGAFSATGTYIVASADLTADKTVGIFSEDGAGCGGAITYPLAATPNAGYAVPGACIEYRITVTNTGTTAAANATDLEVLDVLPGDLSFVQASQNGFTGGVFNTPGSGQDCSGSACTVELTSAGGTPAELAAGATGVIVIRTLVK